MPETSPAKRVAVFKSDLNQFFFWKMPGTPTNGDLNYTMRTYIDSDDENKDRIICYNMFDNWAGSWIADQEN